MSTHVWEMSHMEFSLIMRVFLAHFLSLSKSGIEKNDEKCARKAKEENYYCTKSKHSHYDDTRSFSPSRDVLRFREHEAELNENFLLTHTQTHWNNFISTSLKRNLFRFLFSLSEVWELLLLLWIYHIDRNCNQKQYILAHPCII